MQVIHNAGKGSPAKCADWAQNGVRRDLGDQALRHHPADAGAGRDEPACTSRHTIKHGSTYEDAAAGRSRNLIRELDIWTGAVVF